MRNLAEKRTEKSELLSEIEKYRECDPEVVECVRQDGVISKDAANRWTGHYLGHYNTKLQSTVVPRLTKPLPPKATPFIRPDFRCTEIVKYYLIVTFKRDQLSYKTIF